MIKIGDKFVEKSPYSNKLLNWNYTVIDFTNEKEGKFAVCVRHYSDGLEEYVRIATNLLEKGNMFYKERMKSTLKKDETTFKLGIV